MTIDITGLPHERITFCPSPLAELGNALHALAEPAHHARLHAWTTATSSALKPELADRLHEADFMWRSTRSDFLLPAQPRETLAEELDDVDRMSDEAFVGAALEISCSSRYSEGIPSPLVDERSRRRALDLAAARGPRQAAFVEQMLAEPTATRASRSAGSWRTATRRSSPTPGAASASSSPPTARHKTALLRRKGLAEALAAASPALSLEEGEQGSRIVRRQAGHGRAEAQWRRRDAGAHGVSGRPRRLRHEDDHDHGEVGHEGFEAEGELREAETDREQQHLLRRPSPQGDHEGEEQGHQTVPEGAAPHRAR
ncbi:hypothetical protein STANM309S_01789 [Streptomyces tanashiensis]